MSDPSLALQGWLVSTMRGAGVAGGRVYDALPKDPVFPYVSLGPTQTLGDDTEDCGDGSEVIVQIDAWSRAVGAPEVKAIASAIRTALKAVPTLSGFDVSVVEFQNKQELRDPDGLTSHAALTFRYLITHTN